jgi:hypothetical protein
MGRTDPNHGTVSFMIFDMRLELMAICSSQESVQREKRSQEWSWDLTKAFPISYFDQNKKNTDDDQSKRVVDRGMSEDGE